tara:strand:+ start:259 stop:453 length:195 start_codon:yes stop_codon:yes gene_type:complete
MAKEKIKKVTITQVKSTISQTSRQRKTILALGLGKINRTVEKNLTPQIKGMINKINHLVEVKEL